jgi:hypothetical protein
MACQLWGLLGRMNIHSQTGQTDSNSPEQQTPAADDLRKMFLNKGKKIRAYMHGS